LKIDTKKTTKKTTKTKIGIDYSLTSPAVCINDGKLWFYYLTSKKKWIGKQSENIIGYEHEDYNDPIERFKNISDFVFRVIEKHISSQIGYRSIEDVFIEGYSFGSKGRGVFQIAENCGILKYRLLEKGIGYTTVVPSVVKKGATGKGNADKDLMYEAFVKEVKIDLKKLFDTEKVGNPISDIVDSYYIQKVGHEASLI
jgi:Holliday junction resolvasome RuvABC endonuclease subunit